MCVTRPQFINAWMRHQHERTGLLQKLYELLMVFINLLEDHFRPQKCLPVCVSCLGASKYILQWMCIREWDWKWTVILGKYKQLATLGMICFPWPSRNSIRIIHIQLFMCREFTTPVKLTLKEPPFKTELPWCQLCSTPRHARCRYNNKLAFWQFSVFS